jgi:hypothetical protein
MGGSLLELQPLPQPHDVEPQLLLQMAWGLLHAAAAETPLLLMSRSGRTSGEKGPCNFCSVPARALALGCALPQQPFAH